MSQNVHINEKFNNSTLPIRFFSFIGLAYASLGWLNESFFHWIDTPLFSHYSEYIAIGIFGVYRVVVEKDPYTRKRIFVLTSMIIGFWAILPPLFGIIEPAFGYFKKRAILGQSLHLPLTFTFFISIILVLLFGRRAVCSWNCPCVGARDTMGNAFRKRTLKGDGVFKYRHLKWILTSFYFLLFLIVLLPVSDSGRILDIFLGVVGILYFGSFFFIPITGNRNWCRWLCPYGQTFGILNKIGFYHIKADSEKCTGCKKCEKECDMGIPIHQLVKDKVKIDVMDCVGCGRCIIACPMDVLHFSDIRDYLPKTQSPQPESHKGHLIKKTH